MNNPCTYIPVEYVMLCLGFIFILCAMWFFGASIGHQLSKGLLSPFVFRFTAIFVILWSLWTVYDSQRNPMTGQFDNGAGCTSIEYPLGE